MRGNNPGKPLTETDRIKQLLIRVGDEGPNYYKRDIDKLSLNLDTYYQKGDQSARNQVIVLMAECVSSLPHKASIYATVASLVSLQNTPMFEALIDKVLEKLRIGLDERDLYRPKCALIFLAELMNIGLFSPFVFLGVIFELFQEADRNLESSQDYYLYIGISIFPYVLDNLREKGKMELSGLVKTIDDLIQRKDRSYLKVLRIRKDQASLNTRLDILWNAIKNHYESGKKDELTAIARPYEQYQTELAGIRESKKNIKIHLSPKDAKSVGFYQSPHYHLLFEESHLNQEASSRINLAVLQEKIADALTIFGTAKKFTVQVLQQIEETYNCSSLIVQGILAEMFNLPKSTSRLIFYSSVLVSFVNEAPADKKEKINKAIQDAANAVLTNCANYDVEALDKFMEWIPHFISNFNFTWDWSSWKYIADQDPNAPEAVLFRGLARKLVQISFHERIKEILPEELRQFLPSEGVTSFEYDSAEAPNHSDAEIIKEKLNAKTAAPEMTQFLKAGDNNLEAKNDVLLDVFIQSLLTRCHVTVTHFNIHLERYSATIKDMTTKESDQLVILDAIRKFYRNSNFHVLLTINGLEDNQLLTSKNIINWLFDSIEKEEDIENNFQLYWDLLFLVISKNATTVQVLQESIRNGDHRDKNPSAKSDLENAVAEQQAIFTLAFKKLNHLIGEIFNNNDVISQVLINRLVQIARKYRREISDIFSNIEEELSQLSNTEVQDALKQIRELKFPLVA